MNNISISGRLVRDPECKEVGDSKTVCDFTLAVNGYRKNQDDTVFIKVKAWDSRAKSCQKFCTKGSLVNISGSLRSNSWQAKDGSNRKEIYVLASDIEFVQSSRDDSASKSENQSSELSSPKPVSSEDIVSEEDLETVPF
jgi:single-strand DNA-binding protein